MLSTSGSYWLSEDDLITGDEKVEKAPKYFFQVLVFAQKRLKVFPAIFCCPDVAPPNPQPTFDVPWVSPCSAPNGGET